MYHLRCRSGNRRISARTTELTDEPYMWQHTNFFYDHSRYQ